MFVSSKKFEGRIDESCLLGVVATLLSALQQCPSTWTRLKLDRARLEYSMAHVTVASANVVREWKT